MKLNNKNMTTNLERADGMGDKKVLWFNIFKRMPCFCPNPYQKLLSARYHFPGRTVGSSGQDPSPNTFLGFLPCVPAVPPVP